MQIEILNDCFKVPEPSSEFLQVSRQLREYKIFSKWFYIFCKKIQIELKKNS